MSSRIPLKLTLSVLICGCFPTIDGQGARDLVQSEAICQITLKQALELMVKYDDAVNEANTRITELHDNNLKLQAKVTELSRDYSQERTDALTCHRDYHSLYLSYEACRDYECPKPECPEQSYNLIIPPTYLNW